MLRGVLHVCWDIYVVVDSSGQTQTNVKQFCLQKKPLLLTTHRVLPPNIYIRFAHPEAVCFCFCSCL